MEVEAETPSQSVARTAQEIATQTDARGRLITVNRLNALQYYRLTKAMGLTANNPASMDLAVIASSVRRIDAMDVAMPLSEREVEFLMQQLDFDGLAAAGEALKKLSVNIEDGIDAAKN